MHSLCPHFQYSSDKPVHGKIDGGNGNTQAIEKVQKKAVPTGSLAPRPSQRMQKKSGRPGLKLPSTYRLLIFFLSMYTGEEELVAIILL